MEIPNFALRNLNPDYDNITSGGEASIFIGSHSSHGYGNLEIFKLNNYFSKVAAKKWHKAIYDMKKDKDLLREIQILMKVGQIFYRIISHTT